MAAADTSLRTTDSPPAGTAAPWYRVQPPSKAVWERLPPGPTGLPLAGSAPDYLRHPLRTVWRGYERYGRAFTLRWFGFPLVWLIGPEGNRLILSEQPHKLLWRPALASLIPLLGEGLLVTDGEYHDWLRRLVLPVFQRQRMDNYLPIMWEHATRHAAAWHAGQELEIDEAMRHLTLGIAGRCFFGLDLSGALATLSRAFYATGPFLDQQWPLNLIHVDLPFTAYGQFRRGLAQLDAFVNGLIAERQADPALAERDDALAALLLARDEHGQGLSARQVRDQVVTLLAAGHDTTAHALSWALYLLAKHPAVLQEVLAEQRRVLGDGPPTPEQVRDLTYLEQVAKESLRLYPPAWAGARTAAEDITFGEYVIPRGTSVIYSPWASHRLPDVFAQPRAFRPERWAASGGEEHPPFAYVPFGGGARLCLGMTFAMLELKVVLSALLARWRLALVPGQRLVLRPRVTLAPQPGVLMRVEVS